MAIANGSKQKGNQSKVFSDQAYTYVKQAVDEFRDTERHLFWKDIQRLKGYSSEYWRTNKTAHKKDEEAPVEA